MWHFNAVNFKVYIFYLCFAYSNNFVQTNNDYAIQLVESRRQQHLTSYFVSHGYQSQYAIHGHSPICGGTIITPKFILTAAHCFFLPNFLIHLIMTDLYVVIGAWQTPNLTTFEGTYSVSTLIPHYSYNPRTQAADIALLELAAEIDDAGPARHGLPLAVNTPKPGELCQTIGWRMIYNHEPKPQELRFVSLTIIVPDTCEKTMKFIGRICATNIYDSGRGILKITTGGPLVCNGEIVGVATHFPHDRSLGYFTDIAYYRSWLCTHVECSGSTSSKSLKIGKQLWFVTIAIAIRIYAN